MPNPPPESRSLTLALHFLGHTVSLTIDRPHGSRHPRCGYPYPVNYGFVPCTRAPDGEELDAYFLGPTEPLTWATGRCLAIVHRLDDDDDKLVVVPTGSPDLDDAAIEAAVAFQEKMGPHLIIRA